MHQRAEDVSVGQSCQSFCRLTVDVRLVLFFKHNCSVGCAQNSRVGDTTGIHNYHDGKWMVNREHDTKLGKAANRREGTVRKGRMS